MQYKQRHQETHIPNQLLEELKLRTEENLIIDLNDKKRKLPPLLNSKNIFMISLIREEQKTNRQIADRKEGHNKMKTITSEANLGPKDKQAYLSSLELKPKPPRAIFNGQSPERVKVKHLFTTPSRQPSFEQENKEKQARVIKMEKKLNQSRFYSKKREKNSLHSDKSSHNMVQLLQRIESLKRMFDTKHQMFTPQKQADLKERKPQKSIVSPFLYQKIVHQYDKEKHPHRKSQGIKVNRDIFTKNINQIQTSRKTIRQSHFQSQEKDDNPKRVVILEKVERETRDFHASKKVQKKGPQKWIYQEELNPWKAPDLIDLEEGCDDFGE